jgi:hypothetical protein
MTFEVGLAMSHLGTIRHGWGYSGTVGSLARTMPHKRN